MPSPDPSASSSPDLRQLIRAFTDRAEKILAHPLAASDRVPLFRLLAHIDPQTNALVRLVMEDQNLPEDSWAHLALLERPIVFTETDDLSLPKLTARIEREHPRLRGMLRPLRQRLTAWKSQVFVGVQTFTEDVPPIPGAWTPASVSSSDDGTVAALWPGEVGAPPPNGVDLEAMTGDWYFADVFFNGCLWHADLQKVAVWNDASDLERQHIAKCAELRAIGAVFFVRSLKGFIDDARADGHDL